MLDWQKKATRGVIKQIKKHLKNNDGKLSDTWKHYLRTIKNESIKRMLEIDKEFAEQIMKKIGDKS